MQPFDWILEDDVRSIAIVGISKNSGKTTLLNHLLREHAELSFGVFSTGIDGEETDTVFKTPKPRVRLNPGTLFCCDTASLDRHGSAVEVLEKLGSASSQRQLWLSRTILPVETEITGPASVAGQTRLLGKILAHGAARVLIDGSLDRKSIALSEAVDAVVALIGASFGSPSAIADELKRLLLLNQIPLSPLTADPALYSQLLEAEEVMACQRGVWRSTGLVSLLGGDADLRGLAESKPEALYFPGAITDSILARARVLFVPGGPLPVVRHPDCLKLSLPKLEQFLRNMAPEALIGFKIRSFALNTRAVGVPESEADDLRARLRREFPHLTLTDIRELAL